MINQVGSAAFQRTEGIITPPQLKERYFFGIDLTDKDGKPVPDSVFQHHINAAVSYIEHKLDIIIFPTEFDEPHDFRAVDYQEFNFIQLKHRPAIKVSEIKAKYAKNKDLVTYPEDWYVLEKEASQVQLAPLEGSTGNLVITASGSTVPLLFGTKDRWPHLFHIKYTAGFCNDQIPVIINEMIGLAAASSLFEILGDLVIRPGVTGESVGIDGANVNTNTSANGPFSARIKAYKDKLNEYLKVAHKYYNGFAFAVP